MQMCKMAFAHIIIILTAVSPKTKWADEPHEKMLVEGYYKMITKFSSGISTEFNPRQKDRKVIENTCTILKVKNLLLYQNIKEIQNLQNICLQISKNCLKVPENGR